MRRKALLIICNNTSSGFLSGPSADATNMVNHLTSPIGGQWYLNGEIEILNNPTLYQARYTIHNYLRHSDYSLFVFSGHGYINTDDRNLQYMELANGDLSIEEVITDVPRQSIIIDACRGFESPIADEMQKSFSQRDESLSGDIFSTRQLFEQCVLSCAKGFSICYSASEDESATDSQKGGAYLFSLLRICELWSNQDSLNQQLPLQQAHSYAINYMRKNFLTRQNPIMKKERRKRYFPLAVKYTSIHG